MLEQLVREGARKMLQDALEAEVDDFLGRRRYQRTEDKRGNRNGHLPERTIGVGMGAVEVKLPRVSDVPTDVRRLPLRNRLALPASLAHPGTADGALVSGGSGQW
jgi:hypothetical protein